MKKIFIYLLVAVFVLSVFSIGIGCKKEAIPAAETTAAKEIHWTFMNAVPYAEDWYKQVLDQYMAKHPEQSYDMSSTPWEEFYGKLSVVAAGKTDIDIIFLDGSVLRDLVASNILVDITDQIGDTSVFRIDHPAYIWKVGDRLYGLALDGMDTMGIYYNKDIFKKYALKVPETYEDLLVVSKTLRKNGIGPLLITGTPAQWWGNQWQQFLSQYTDDPSQYVIDIVAGKRKFTDPESLEAFRWIKKFKDDGIWVDNATGIDENTSYSMFITGKAAMFYQGTWVAPILISMAGGIEKLPQIGVTHYPYVTPEHRLTADGGFALGSGIYSGISKEKLQPALDLLRYMTSAEVTKTLGELDMAPLSSRKDVTLDMNPLTKEFVPLADATVTWSEWYFNQQLKETFWENLSAVAGGLISPEEAAQNTQNVVK